jgi:peptidyl-prolyl cis-trans isomerase C
MPTMPSRPKALAAIQGLKTRIGNGENFAAPWPSNTQTAPARPRVATSVFSVVKQMVPPFSEAAFALEPGQTSDVVQNPLRLPSDPGDRVRQAEQTMAFNDVKDAISKRLRQESGGGRRSTPILRSSRSMRIFKDFRCRFFP